MTWSSVCLCACVCVCVFVCVRVHVSFMCMFCVYACASVCVCQWCMHIHIYVNACMNTFVLQLHMGQALSSNAQNTSLSA